MTELELCEYLKKYHRGQGTPISSRRLERVSGASGRTVRKYVNRLRQDGQPICSDRNGYYYADGQEEVNETVSRLNGFMTRVGNARTGLMYAKIAPAQDVLYTVRTVVYADGRVETEVTAGEGGDYEEGPYVS